MEQLSIAGKALQYFHVCALFNSREEEFSVLNPFYKEGLDQGEQNMHIINPEWIDEHRAWLRSGGIDTDACEQCGQLALVPWDEAYLDDQGTFDKDRMLATVDELTGSGREAGYKRLRIMGNMGWAQRSSVDPADVIQYEAEVNEVLSRNKQPAVCVYDISKLSGAMVMDLLRTHPLTLINGVIQENPFFTPPAEMLAELRARRTDASRR